jgi:hypothetical protein
MQQGRFLRGLGTCAFVAVSLLAACHGTDTAQPDTAVPAGDAAGPSEPGKDAAPGAADTLALPDAVSYAPNSRKCSLSFGQASDCDCSDGTPGASDPSQCSVASVVTSQVEQGVCCEDAFGCECIGYTCSGNASTCVCSNIGDMMLPADGTAARECPAPTATQKCCLQRYTHRCICSSSSQCTESGAVEVSSCRVVDVATCPSDATSLTNCK